MPVPLILALNCWETRGRGMHFLWVFHKNKRHVRVFVVRSDTLGDRAHSSSRKQGFLFLAWRANSFFVINGMAPYTPPGIFAYF